MVATSWHQIGRVHSEAGHLEASEEAYRQALAIRVRENDLLGQADSLGGLGHLYGLMDRKEEAVTLYKQGLEIRVTLGDLAGEGTARNNLALALLELQRYEEARPELLRAIECKEPYGHSGQPWMTWAILKLVERATGHTQDAEAARSKAIETYLAYRRAGGDSYSGQVRFSPWSLRPSSKTPKIMRLGS